jgi:hypothetical protein
VQAQSSPEAAPFDLFQSLVLLMDDERPWGRLECGDQEQTGQRPTPSHLIVSDYRLRGAENGIQVVEMLRSEFNVDIPARLRTPIANLLREHTCAA